MAGLNDSLRGNPTVHPEMVEDGARHDNPSACGARRAPTRPSRRSPDARSSASPRPFRSGQIRPDAQREGTGRPDCALGGTEPLRFGAPPLASAVFTVPAGIVRRIQDSERAPALERETGSRIAMITLKGVRSPSKLDGRLRFPLPRPCSAPQRARLHISLYAALLTLQKSTVVAGGVPSFRRGPSDSSLLSLRHRERRMTPPASYGQAARNVGGFRPARRPSKPGRRDARSG